MDICEVAQWFLNKKSLTPKKLQKLVYYAYAWFLTLMNEDKYNLDNRLFNDRAQAWIHGPVFPKLYNEYKEYGYMDIPSIENKPRFSEDVEDVLEQVWEVYGKFNANQLESITHSEEPWIKARGNVSPEDICTNEIDDSEIFMCYSKRLTNGEEKKN
ncbi:MAG: DUF4065 domain-containing protein [Tissierellia bacterium]|nr:DUF4065 domain-containing protein [Tissierellia bacterium]